ncbi:MAG: aldehyde dehydrogenase family protein, partial [Pseudomonadota bacterium]
KALSDVVTYEDDQEINYQTRVPFGVMVAILAWNFPFANFARSTTQALLAGNVVIIKYSEEIPLFAQLLENLIAEVNIPENIFNFVYGDGLTGKILCQQNIDFISFTGSSATGQKIYKTAAHRLIPVELELGGSSPGIVFADCKIDDALVAAIFKLRFSNSGQFCTNLKRLLVHESLFAEIIDKLVAYVQTQKIGLPSEPTTVMGPLSCQRQLTLIEQQFNDAITKGAVVHCGGKQPQHLLGAYFEPTILSKISFDMRVWQEEVFGPILPIIPFNTYEQAIDLANDTPYGLTAYVYTNSKQLAEQAMNDIKAGCVQHNFCNYHRPENPFGGFKLSGLGRQKGLAGFEHVTQTKIIAVEKTTKS